MTEVLSVKYEETGKVVYVLPNQNYQVGDYLVIKNKKGCRLAQVVTANEDMDEVKLPAEWIASFVKQMIKIFKLIKRI